MTSCPACDTRFHVKPEQLAIHHGLVRCGQCQHVFTTDGRLYELLENAPASPSFSPDTIEAPIVHEYGDSSEDPAAHLEDAAYHTDPNDLQFGQYASPYSIPEELIPSEETAPSQQDEFHVPETDDSVEAPLPAEDILISPHPIHQPQPAAMPDTFLREKKSGKASKLKIPLWLTIPLCILLLLTAAGQAMYFFRTELASLWPASKPFLVSSCEFLGCEIPLSKNPELLALDDSDLQEDIEHPEVIQLSTTLINNATFVQAYPMLELTLTDDDDKPKLRRIFKPSEYLPSETDIEAGIPANEEIQIKLSLSTSGETVSGYRVFVTY
ncbi:zinc-ribbon and DUF3426 domain-containing protein [Methylobacillus caricis]|uniref:zinc-ribbon and DUF3426 domain-containing protein n=1 Tax=Methylobacillus caricis TaxID=1971611 RepID=UPI00299EC95A|nr:zinc-ribbon and DUF3426 domain-containing protein [Methylobacillus caricis]